MKTKIAWCSVISAAALAFSGCGQKEETAAAASTAQRETKAPTTAESPSSSPVSLVTTVASTSTPAPATNPAVAQPPAETPAPAPPALAEPVDPVKQVQGLIDNARSFVDRKFYTIALSNMRSLVLLSMTPEQKTAVEKMKADIKEGMGEAAYEAAVKAMGGFPKRKE